MCTDQFSAGYVSKHLPAWAKVTFDTKALS